MKKNDNLTRSLDILYKRIKQTSLDAHDEAKERAQLLRIVDFLECVGPHHRDQIAVGLSMGPDIVSTRLNEACNILGVCVYLNRRGKTRRKADANYAEVVPGMMEAWKDPEYDPIKMRLFEQAEKIDAAFDCVRKLQDGYLDILREWHNAVGFKPSGDLKK